MSHRRGFFGFGNDQAKGSMVSPIQKNGDNSTFWVVLVVVIFIVIILGGCWCWTHPDEFGNIKNKFMNRNTKLKDLEVIMFMKPSCPYCQNMMKVLEKEGQLNNLTIVDVSKPEGQKMAQQFGAQKVPSFISRRNKIGMIGYRDSVKQIIEELNPQKDGSPQGPSSQESGTGTGAGNMDINFIKDLKIVLLAKDSCGWCRKAKEECANMGILDVIQVVDIMSPEGQEFANKMLPPGTSGVPVWLSLLTNKHIVGYKAIDQIIQELK